MSSIIIAKLPNDVRKDSWIDLYKNKLKIASIWGTARVEITPDFWFIAVYLDKTIQTFLYVDAIVMKEV